MNASDNCNEGTWQGLHGPSGSPLGPVGGEADKERPPFPANRFQYLLDGAVGPEALRTFLSFVKDEVPNDCAGIDVLIRSVGGSVPVALAFAELLLSLPCGVRTCNLANVDSASIIVFAAGKERLAPRGTTFFLHPVGKEVVGVKTAAELRRLADEIEHDTFRETEFLARRTGTDARKWRDMMDRETRIDSVAACALGLATSVASLAINPASLVVKTQLQGNVPES